MERHILFSVIVLVCINVMDSILGAVKSPTLIFYINELGGDTQDYGLISSVGALANIIMIPFYGNWVDSNGNKYKPPYFTSFFLGIVANTIYFLAVLLPKGRIAVYAIIFAKLLGGAAGAGRTLSYSWVASTILPDKQRTILTFLSSARILGSVIGPLTNYLVSEVDTEFRILGLTIPLDPNNTIGLLCICGEMILVALTLLFLQEPPEQKAHKKVKVEESGDKTETKGVMYALTHFDIFLPIFTMFVVFCIFCLQVAFSPVARDIGYTPVDISEISAIGSIIMASAMAISVALSMTNVSDVAMLSFGMGTLLLSGSFMYTLWTVGVGYWQLSLPLFLLMFGYPFIGPANRSRYSQAIYNNKELQGSHGIMMGLINQAGAIAGLVAPLIVTSFILREPADVAASSDKHLLTAGALFFPASASLVIVAVLYKHFFRDLPSQSQSNDDSDAVSENTTLLSRAGKETPRSSLFVIRDSLSRSSESYRRISVEIMGIPNPVETKFEQELNKRLLKDKELWDEIESFDAIED